MSTAEIPPAPGSGEPEAKNAAGETTSIPPNDLERLRSLLFQQEINLLRNLQERLDDPAVHARDVSRILVEALLLRGTQDERLIRALHPAVETIFRSSVRKHPRDLANTLFPLMGPAIRKAISEAFRTMLQGLNKALEMSLSWKGLRWRFEALRTGKSFAEVVLLHTLVYRVEQVFLIHAETGLLLGHVSEEGLQYQDADLVSGMLTAVQDFVKDCFTSGAEDSLDTLQMGERVLMVEKGSHMVLACVVRGEPPSAFRQMLRDTVEIIELESADELNGFHGDVDAFAPMARHLEECLIARYVDENKPVPLFLKAMPVLFLLAAFAGIGYVWWQEYLFDQAVARLQATPGIVLTGTTGSCWKGWTIFALRDPLAANPQDILSAASIKPEQYTLGLTSLTSLEPTMVETRLHKALDTPDTATLRFENGTLFLEGEASLGWILATPGKALSIPGVERVDTDKIVDPRTAQLQGLVAAVEHTRIEFPLGKDQPVPEDRDKLSTVVDNLEALSALARQMGLAANLIIYGHADPSGTEKRNYELSIARATTLASMLYSRGVPMPVTTYGFGAEHQAQGDQDDPELIKQRSRRIELRIHLSYLGKSLLEM
jgi:OOP family OmpA-OmpF porin